MPELRPLSPIETIPYVGEEKEEEQRQGMQWGRFVSNPLNELRYFGGQAREFAQEALIKPIQEFDRGVENIDEGYTLLRGGRVPVYRDPKGQLTTQLPSTQNIRQGMLRSAVQPLQYLGDGADQLRRGLVNAAADAAGPNVPREEELLLNKDAKRVQGFGQFTMEAAVGGALTAGAGGLLSPALRGLVGMPITRNVAGRLPSWMTSRPVRRTLKWAAAGAGEEVFAGVLQDPFANQALGSNIQPEDPAIVAAAKNMPGNAAAGLVLGGAIEGGAKLTGKAIKGIVDVLPNTSRRTREKAQRTEVENSRRWTEENGIQRQNEDGTYEFTEEAQGKTNEQKLAEFDAKKTEQDTGIPTAPMTEGGAVLEGKLPEADPEVDPWNPEAIEVDAAAQALEQLDDQGTGRVAEAPNKLEAIEAELNAEPELVGMNVRAGSAPTEAVADPVVAFRDQFEALDNSDLLSMAYPDNSPELFRRVQLMTGKEFEQFTRPDVLAGIEALASEDGVRLLPNRFGFNDTLPVDDIQTDPRRFQYKEGVDSSGRQIGESLDKVKKWNVDMEDVIDVWEDPDDGLTYVVNGHNRLALAKKLGVKSMRVSFLNAPKDFQARALGAIKNIGQGAGTPFDAAKFIREQGLQTAEELKAVGIPLEGDRSLGSQGLALSRLPDSVFQRAVNGELSLSKAIVLGNSGLSDEAMIRLVRVLDSRDVTDRAFIEMADMAKTAPVVKDGGDQTRLPGMEETLDTIAIKADLAGAIRAELNSNKNLFKKVGRGKNVSKLANEAGTTVNEAGASEAAGRAQAALGVFNAEKYAAGTEISALLNQATQDIAEGKKPKVVKDRLLREVLALTEDAPAPKAAAAAPEPAKQSLDERYANTPREKLAQMRQEADGYLLTDRKRKNREKLAAEDDANNELSLTYIKELPGSKAPEEMTEEAFMAKWGPEETHPRLHAKGSKYKKAKKDLERDEWAREFIEWYDNRDDLPLTPEQRNGRKKEIIKQAIADGDVRPTAAELPTTIEGDKAKSLEELEGDINESAVQELQLAERYAAEDAFVQNETARKQRELDGFYEKTLTQNLEEGLFEQFPDVAEAPYELPADVAKSKPRYGMGTVAFGSDFDRAAYILQSKSSSDRAKKTKATITKSLEEAGYDIAQVRKHGEKVKQAIGDQVQEMTGSRRAPQESMEIAVPEVRFSLLERGADGLLALPSPELPPTPTPGRPIRDQEQIRMMLDAEIERIIGKRPASKNLFDAGPSEEFKLPKIHGGDGVAMTTAAGRYYSASDVIAIYDLATQDINHLQETAWHESWHRLQFQNLTRKEMAVLNGAKARSRLEEMASLPIVMNAMKVAGRKPASLEMQAFAFQKYAAYRKMGIKDPFTRTKKDNAFMAETYALQYADALDMNVRDMAGDPLLDMFLEVMGKDLTTTFKKFFDKLYTMLERLENFAKGNGFQSVKDVYERAYSGGMASRKKIYDAKLISALVSSKNQKKFAKGVKLGGISEQRGEFIDLWQLDNDPDALAEFLDRGSRQIQFNRDELITQAIKEGC